MINIVIYIIAAFMLFRLVMMQKKNKSQSKLISIIQKIDSENEFFEEINELIENEKNPEAAMKAKVIRLWGVSYHKHIQEFEENLKAVRPEDLMQNGKSGMSIAQNEDSFFYLYIAIPQILETNGMRDFRRMLYNKMQAYDNEMQNQMVAELGKQLESYYESEGDKGLAFYEKVLSGDYSEYTYSKSLIGLYKGIMNAQAARIYLDHGQTAKFDECKDLMENFKQTSVGKRWLKGLKIDLEEKKNEEDADTEVFDMRDEEEKK